MTGGDGMARPNNTTAGCHVRSGCRNGNERPSPISTESTPMKDIGA
jgi:hypothetical protein